MTPAMILKGDGARKPERSPASRSRQYAMCPAAGRSVRDGREDLLPGRRAARDLNRLRSQFDRLAGSGTGARRALGAFAPKTCQPALRRSERPAARETKQHSRDFGLKHPNNDPRDADRRGVKAALRAQRAYAMHPRQTPRTVPSSGPPPARVQTVSRAEHLQPSFPATTTERNIP